MAEVLVTGGAGFIGSHLVDALVERGDRVRVVDALFPQVHESRPSYLQPRVDYRFKDLRDPGAVPEALEGVDTVFHLAAAVGVGQSMYQVDHYVDANSRATAVLLQALTERTHRVRKLIVASSMSIYGEGAYRCPSCGPIAPSLRPTAQLASREWEVKCPQCGMAATPVPTPEEKPLQPTSVYAVTKRDQEELALAVGRAFGIPTVALRFFNVYGTRQALSNPYTGVCAIFGNRLLHRQPPIVFEDGKQSRDFVSVHDIVRGMLLAESSSAADYRALNLGTGRPTTVAEIAALLGRLHGQPIPAQVTGEFRAGDIRHCIADISKARDLIGFRPSVPLEEGLAEFVAWSRTQGGLDRSETAYRELADRGLVQGGQR
ncbi:MAG TPA: NAD-dependent epimerase/dehydratase family protein [Thermoplasmata archaeon]|nr:NAD-dependent epimerase/dehydratase family protein [Thermoplasmata archaeon]